MPTKGYIRIQDTRVIKDKILVYTLSFSRNLRRIILSEKFYVKYDRPVSNVEKSILNIPGVGSLATVVWATGSELIVNSLDKNYVHSILSKFRKFNNIQFNNVFTSGKITVGELKDNKFNNQRQGLLFSGGVDSTSLYILTRREKPELITIIGGVIPVNNRKFITNFKKHYTEFASRENVAISFIETNVRDVINEGFLTGKYGKYTGYMHWWRLVHSFIQFSLCAPITKTNMIGSILYANSMIDFYNSDYRNMVNSIYLPNGGNNLSVWSDVDVIYKNSDISRQKEINAIKKKIKDHGNVKLQVCNFSPKYDQINCGICDKCIYTMTGLLLEDLDPSKLGFPIEKNFSDYVMKHVSKGKIDLAYWRNIQKNIPRKKKMHNSESVKLFNWLKKQKLKNREKKKGIHIAKYLLFIFYAVLPSQVRNPISNLGRRILWTLRKNLIHLVTS